MCETRSRSRERREREGKGVPDEQPAWVESLVTKVVSKAVEEMQKEHLAHYGELKDAANRQEKSLSSLENRFAAHERKYTGDIAEIRKELHLQANGVPASRAAAAAAMGDDRQTDQSIIVLEAASEICKKNLKNVEEYISGIVPPTGFKVEGSDDNPSKRFVIRFSGNDGHASKRVSTVLGSLRLGGGKFKDLHAEGGTRVYLYPDKNARQLRAEAAFRKLKRIIMEKKPGFKMHFNWMSGVVSSNWKGFVEIKFDPDTRSAKLDWAPENSTFFQLDTESITQEFHKAFSSTIKEPSWV